MQPTIGMNFKKYLFEQFTEDLQDKVKSEILDKFNFWLPFVDLKGLEVKESKSKTNGIDISVTFNIKKDPRSMESVQVSIGE